MKLDFLEFGEGKPIVFLHGWQQDKKSFAPLVFLDLPGFGESEFPLKDFNSFDYAKTVMDWIKDKKLKDVILLGHSFGGKVAAIVVKENPKLVKKLILIAGSGVVKKEKHQVLKKVLPGFVKDLFRQHLVSRDYRQAGKLLAVFKKIVKEDITGIYRNIRTPTLIIWGKDDEELPVENGRKINALINGSKLEIIEGGHFPFWDNPQKVAELIDKFTNGKG